MRSSYFQERRLTVYGSIATLACMAVLWLTAWFPLWMIALFLLLGIPPSLQIAFIPVLVVTDEWLEYRPYALFPDRWRGWNYFRHMMTLRRRVVGTEIESLAWGASDGADNVGLRIRDGTMEYVSFYLVAPSERAQAQQDILRFVARFTGPSRQASS